VGGLRELSIGKVCETLGIENMPVDGILDIYTDARLRSGHAEGRVHILANWLEIDGPESMRLPPLRVELDLVGAGREMDAVIELERQDGRDQAPHLSLGAGGSVPQISDINDAKRLLLGLKRLDAKGVLGLHLVRELLPKELTIEGELDFNVHLVRTLGGEFSKADVRARSHGLVITAPRPSDQGQVTKQSSNPALSAKSPLRRALPMTA
jgi:hypothetical protein